jgi:hypothetical protein
MTPEPDPSWRAVERDPGDEDPSYRLDDAFFALVAQLHDAAADDERP